MNGRILTDVRVGTATAVVSQPRHVLDDATRALLEQETARARAEGEAAGRAAGLAAARAEASAVATAVERATAQLAAVLERQHAALAAALGERVLGAVAAVLGHEPDDDGRRLVDAIVDAVATVDDEGLRVRVAPARTAVVDDALGRASLDTNVEVVADAALGADDAMLDGPFAHVDLRRSTMLEALAELLDEAGPLGPLPVDDVDAEVGR